MSGTSDESRTRIDTLEELQQRLPSILERLNGDAALSRAAAANPLLALEELGYDLAPAVREDIEERGRFSQQQAARRREFREQIRRAAGRDVDVTSGADVRRLLVEELRIDPASVPENLSLPVARPRLARPRMRMAQPGAEEDPLGLLRGRHDAIEPILALRDLEANTLRFASPHVYRTIRSGERKLLPIEFRVRPASSTRPPKSARRSRRKRNG